MTQSNEQPKFTRYLYEFHQVKHSLVFTIMEKKREEALFWAYELYHSGFKEELWQYIMDLYLEHYSECNPKFKTRLKKFYIEWRETGNDCLVGTVVGTLAVLNHCTRESEVEVNEKPNKPFIIIYKEDRHKTLPVTNPARTYLKMVSTFAIHPDSKSVAQELDGVSPETIREAYLGQKWIYYCSTTPLWASRLNEGRGQIVNEDIVFENDDFLEEFYDKWGFEPDEQSMEIHQLHGIY
jgi:hypothetical protein